jgi:hypothetical protein
MYEVWKERKLCFVPREGGSKSLMRRKFDN